MAVTCDRCGRQGRMSRHSPWAATLPHVLCPPCRAATGALLPRAGATRGPEMVPVRCFRCGRAGRISARTALRLDTTEILCPWCRGERRAGLPLPASGRAEPPSVTRPKPLIGRPSLLLLRSALPVRAAEQDAPPEPSRRATIRCFDCGRPSRLSPAAVAGLAPREIVCPECRAVRRMEAPRSRPLSAFAGIRRAPPRAAAAAT